jgi:parvulin-like peptidyl-prolyl isomerase
MIVAALLLANALAAAPPDPVLAHVDGEPVRASMVLARAARVKAMGGGDLPRAKVLEAIVDDLVVAREGRKTGVEKSPAVVAGVDAERRRIAADLFAAREISNLEPSEATLRELYHGRADSFRMQLATFPTRPEAEAALARLAAGGPFSEEALRSLDPRSKKAKGDLGTVSRMELSPALAAAATAAPLGKPYGPVALELGQAVIVVSERAIGDQAGYAAAAEGLRTFAREQLRREARKHLLAQLRSAAGVKLDEAFLKSTGNRLEATPEEAAHAVAVVRGRKVRWGDVLPSIRRTVGGEGHLSGMSVKSEFAWAEVDRVLLEEEALRRGFGDGPEAAAAIADARAWLTAQAVGAALRSAVPAPDAAAIERYYAQHAAEFRRPERRACADILLESRADAERAQKRLAAGERFEDVARQLSQDRETAAAGGALGEFPLANLDALAKSGERALAQALREAKPGVVTGPVYGARGLHLVRCGAVLPAGTAPLAEVRATIAERVQAQEQDAALTRRMQQLRGAARVEIDERALAALDRARA